MPLPAMPWTLHTPYVPSGAGAALTVPELLAGLKNAIDTAAAGTGKWEVADFNAGNGTLVIKRKGTPSGELGTVRIIVFGGSTPNAAACGVPWATLGTTRIFVGVVIDPTSGTAPDASYTAGSPYPGKKYVRAMPCGLNDIATATANIQLFDCDEALGFRIGDGTGVYFGVGGRLMINDATQDADWCAIGVAQGRVAAVTTPTFEAVTGNNLVPSYYSNVSGNWGMSYWSTALAASRSAGRGAGGQVNYSGGECMQNAAVVSLLPILVAECPTLTAQTPNYHGRLRQIRMGPQATNGVVLRDSGGNIIARHIAPGNGSTISFGVWLSES